ncbi:hypothetical protein AVEN_260201-1 [Araneus ventricosus]|uniref:Uncharacterized protein n=1 Tax=Araneus ventricosus TaxID=182803 RepID=A0A4Y2JXW5_ARAVE|nr:hypothetical protein AVEN_260201-1 [Araneus ventricosus]
MSPLKKSDAELQKYFEFELAPFPLSHFDEGGLRKTRNKPHCKGKGCTNSPDDDNVITNSANQEAKIDIRMEKIISDVDLEEECQTMQVEESESQQTDINDYDSH